MTMDTRLDGALPRSSGPGGSQAGSAAAGQVRGQFRGLAVIQQVDPMSLLADMAEELSLLASEYEELSIEDRKSARDQRSSRRKTEASYALGDLNEEELGKFISFLRREKTTGTGEINNRLTLAFREPFHRHAALTRAQEELGRENPELAAELEGFLKELEAAHGPEIRAGYNLAEVSARGLAGGQAELRTLYAETVLDCESLTQAMQTLVERYGAENFPGAVKTLFKALSADISASKPSLDRVRLKVMMDDMYQLEVLGNTYRDCAALLDKTRTAHPPPPGVPLALARAEDLMRPLFRLKDEAALLSSQVRALMPFIRGNEDPLCDVRLTQGVKGLARALPHRIFESQAKRQALLDAIQELADEAIEREEEMEA